ncbi:cytochrome P450, family 724, subfamily A, polypeptide 1 [Hibiscus trionum]|uniref:Cytochrome P450 724B1 n=1 Tax=Hibiscus trionum TaxID=183268 RepID=A0A9W7J7J6_HIBTR|nr:cytochrome P450, family 724, subfamily A, polypeptide 1 [Hibiscus trionum]
MFDFFPLILSAFLLGLGLGLHLLVKAFAKHEPANLPHGSMGLPLVGETLGFLKPHRSNSMGTFLQQHCSRYGRVFKSHLFGSPTIVSCDHELNMLILQTEEKLFQVSYPKAMHGILGKFSMIIVSGDIHKKLRNMGASFITASKSNPDFLNCVEKMAISMMNSWKDCEQIGFCKEVKKFTLNLMVKHLLSIEPEEPLAFKILEDFLTYMKGFVSLPVYLPGTAYASAVKARARLSATVRGIIKERQKEMLRHGKEDFLDAILTKESLSDEETVSVVLDLLLAGYETTATLTALIVYFLALYPNVLQHLKREHDAIRKNKKNGEPLNWEDYQKMEFTYNVIYESMRCGNVVKFLHRVALQDVKFKGHFIPAGWKILPMLTAVHFDPSLHEDPMEFNPWRWTDKATTKKVMPFGGGPRLCPGADLAKVEIAFFLHHLVLNYRWKTMADDFPLAYPYVEFKRGLLLEIEPIQDMAGNIET